MSRTYKAIGINLKSMPMGEADRLLTILTREFGLVRVVAMGSRKHQSSLGGRSGLFVVNDLLIAKGRSLDKLTQAETLESYPGLSQDLKKLTASQYLAELCLYQALSDQPQEALFYLLNEHLKRLERSPADQVLPHLTHAVFQLLVLAGVAPQVHACCVTRQLLTPDLTRSNWQVGFSIPAGGTVTLEVLETLKTEKRKSSRPVLKAAPQSFSYQENLSVRSAPNHGRVAEDRQNSRSLSEINPTQAVRDRPKQNSTILHIPLTAAELSLLQHLAEAELPHSADHEIAWHSIERALRHYAQYHFDQPIRSATLIDACFVSANPPLSP